MLNIAETHYHRINCNLLANKSRTQETRQYLFKKNPNLITNHIKYLFEFSKKFITKTSSSLDETSLPINLIRLKMRMFNE